MIERLDEKQRRMLALGILGFIVAAILSVTVLPLWLVNSGYQARIDQLQERLQRFGAIAAQDPELRRRFADLQRAQSSRGHFLAGDSEATAAAELQRIIKEISSANGTQLLSTQILPAADEDGMLRIGLRVRISGAMPGLMESVYDLESNEVFLFLENFSMRQATGRRIRATVPLEGFEANFDLIAYMQEMS
ncbi:MAG: type II secretion system protein GspM [Gammaproteobacteria bacterium]|nr:type II secretion system protein GspM [Gammaproteobacteria bacterium]MDH4253161.1 type II secretion system protein GspM [Gammaproteobacteria bacterium]MDH5308477.1 type II secretion system protein GspM [Gammaproteobacteria bacterium]